MKISEYEARLLAEVAQKLDSANEVYANNCYITLSGSTFEIEDTTDDENPRVRTVVASRNSSSAVWEFELAASKAQR